MPSLFSAGSASVEIVPDFSNAQRRIGEWFAGQRNPKVDVDLQVPKTQLAQMHAEVAAQHPKLHVDIDTDSVKGFVDRMVGLSQIGGIFKGMFSPKAIGLTDAVGAAVALSSAIGQAGGAAALLPAAIGLVGAPVAALMVGVQGLGTAFKNAFDPKNAAQFQAAMEKLSPAGREFVTSIVAIKPAWDSLQLAVQTNLLLGLGQQIQSVAGVFLPVLREGLQETGSMLNFMASQFLDTISAASNLSSLDTVFTNINSALSILGGAIRPVVQAFIDITTVGSSFLPTIAVSLTNAAQAFGNWVAQARESGQLATIIGNGLSVIRELMQIVGSLGSALFSILRAANDAGQSLLGTVYNLVSWLAAFLKTDVAQSSLKTFFDGIASAAQTLLPVIERIVSVLVTSVLPVFGQILNGVAGPLSQWLGELATMIQQIMPLIYPAVVNAFIAWEQAIAPVIPAITSIAKDVLPILANVLQQLAPLVSTFTGLLGSTLAQAVSILAPVIQSLANSFIQVLQAIMPILPILAGALIQALQQLAPLFPVIGQAIVSIVQALVPLIPPLIQIAQMLIPVLVQVITPLIPIIVQLAQILGQFLLAAMNALMPIIKVVIDVFMQLWTAIQPLLPVILQLVQAVLPPLAKILTDLSPIIAEVARILGAVLVWTISNIVVPIIQVLSAVFSAMAAAILWAVDNIILKAWDAISAAATWLWNNILSPIWSAMQAAWNVLMTAMKWVWDYILHPVWVAIETAINWLWNNILLPIWTAMQTDWNMLLAAMKWAWDYVLHPVWVAVETAINWLWNNVLSPIWSAMQTAWNGLLTAMKWVYDNVLKPMFDAFGAAINVVKDTFNTVVNAIQTAWDKLKEIAAAPIRFVVNTILNKGLFAGWNWISDHILGGALHIDPIQLPFAYGGMVPGYSPNKRADNINARLTAGEFVQPVDSVSFYGPGAMEAIRTRQATIAYADGGIVPGAMTWQNLWQTISKQFPNAVLTSGYRPGAADYHGKGDAIDIGVGGNLQSGLMPIAAWIAAHFANSTELIHNPNASIKNGAAVPPSFWGAATWAEHANHVHWAMTPEAIAGGGGGGGSLVGFLGKAWSSATDVLADLTSSITGPLADFIKQFNTPFGQLLYGVPGKALGAMWNVIKDQVGAFFSTVVGLDANTPGSSGSIKQQAFQIAGDSFGWHDSSQQQALDFIATKESNWNPTAQNPSSSASGIWQMITSTWQAYKNAGPWPYAKNAPPGEQDFAAYRYIRDRYGDPLAAMSYWKAHNSYDRGGYLPPGLSTVWNGTGRREAVLSAAETDSRDQWRRRHHGRDRDDFGGLMRDVIIQHQDGNPREIMDELWHRLRVARRGGVYSTPYSTVALAG